MRVGVHVFVWATCWYVHVHTFVCEYRNASTGMCVCVCVVCACVCVGIDVCMCGYACMCLCTCVRDRLIKTTGIMDADNPTQESRPTTMHLDLMEPKFHYL